MAVTSGAVVGRRPSARALRSMALLVVVLVAGLWWWSAGAAAGAETTVRAAGVGVDQVNQVWPLLWLSAGGLLVVLAWIGARRAGHRKAPAAS